MPKTWFITGASCGLGARIAQQALARGDNVVATARDPHSVTPYIGALGRLLPVALDVADAAQAQAAVAQAIAHFGQIDILLNNAGFGLLGAVEEATAEEVQQLYATNVFGLLSVTRAVLPHMRQRHSGHVLNVSSVGGYAASAGWGVYNSTKFAVEGLSEALALELAPLGIHVTIIELGFFRTDFLDGASLAVSAPRIADYADTSRATRNRAMAANYTQPGDPTKLAKAVLKLVDAKNPPLRMPYGGDTVQRIEAKNAFVADELARWRDLVISTDATP